MNNKLEKEFDTLTKYLPSHFVVDMQAFIEHNFTPKEEAKQSRSACLKELMDIIEVEYFGDVETWFRNTLKHFREQKND